MRGENPGGWGKQGRRRAHFRFPQPVVLLLLLGCGRPIGPRPIAMGTPCSACGMTVQDLKFACERRSDRAWRVYDSIECLLSEGSAGRIYLADYDAGTLHAADSMWVVHGEFPSPMGGGYVAFLDRGAANEIAGSTQGQVNRLEHFASPVATP